MALATWGLTPEWINENWTEELLWLMFKYLDQRLNRGPAPATATKRKEKKIEDGTFFHRQSSVRVIRHGS